MTTPQSALDRYLALRPQPMPYIKGANPRALSNMIGQKYGTYYKPKTTPRGRHQLEGIAFALMAERALLFYDMRLGKTKISLDWAAHLRRSGRWQKKGLVIVHAPIALDVWESETPKHSDLKATIVRTKMEEFLCALEDDSDLVVIAWSGLQQIFSEKKNVKVHKLVKGQSTFVKQNKMVSDSDTSDLAAEAFDLAIVDEIHRAKNRSTIRFKVATSLMQYCHFRMGLTGTPFGRDPFDLWAQAFLIDGGAALGGMVNLFKEAFGLKKKGFQGRETFVFDPSKEGILREKMASLVISYQRSEVHDVNVLTGMIELQMATKQALAYSDALDQIIRFNFDETQEIRNSFVRLRQISSGYVPFVGEDGTERIMQFPYNPKLEWLMDFVEENQDVQVLIFHEFTLSGQMICEALKDAKKTFGWLYGGTPDTQKVVNDFNSGKTQYLVANTAKGGMAIDLPNADYILFFESPTSPIIRQQAEARPMSRGSKTLVIDDMVCSGVERRILSFIAEGKDLLHSLVHLRAELR